MNTHGKRLTGLVTVILLFDTGAVAYAGGKVDTTFNKINFSANSSATIDNPYWPLALPNSNVLLQYKRDMKSKTLDVAFGSSPVLKRNRI